MSDHPLSEAVRSWVEDVAGAAVTSARPLPGGTHADTYLVTTGPGRDVVVRTFPPGDSAAGREARILGALDGLDGLCPRLLASDADGSLTGGPATVISRLRGAAEITAGDPDVWAADLGRALARVHATPLAPLRGLPRLADTSGGQRVRLGGPAADLVAAGWDDLYAAPEVLTHYDFWSGNVVWESGAVSGVVDWSGAALGPASFDLGWCRLDLVLLYGERIADVLTRAYTSASDGALPDIRLADLWAVARSHGEVETWAPNYLDLGRRDLDGAELGRRYGAWVAKLVPTRPDAQN